MISIADMHCDTISKIRLARLDGREMTLRTSNENMIDLLKMQTAGYTLQNFALYCDKGRTHDPLWTQATEMLDIFKSEMSSNTDLIRQVFSYSDIEKNRKEGLMSALLTIEEGAVIEDDIDRLDFLYQEGVRMMTLTWNFETQIGYPNVPKAGFETDFRKYFEFVPDSGNGLKPLGFDVVERMNELGMIVDVSHLSDAGFYDVADVVKGPFCASHSNARSICGCNRNMTDAMIRTVGEHGGVIGLNFCQPFIEEADREEDCRMTCRALAEHARHMMNLGGTEVVGLGTDFDGIEPGNMEIEHAGQMQHMAEAFSACGFIGDEIDRIFYKNVMRFYSDML